MKYHPGFPGRFPDLPTAIAFCRTFFPWYNAEHRHGGIAMLTPHDVHHGRAKPGSTTAKGEWTSQQVVSDRLYHHENSRPKKLLRFLERVEVELST